MCNLKLEYHVKHYSNHARRAEGNCKRSDLRRFPQAGIQSIKHRHHYTERRSGVVERTWLSNVQGQAL